MTTPVASGPLYASVADLREVMSSTDSGIGTPAQLSDDQLNQCLYSASNRVSVYVGGQYDSSSADATPPAIFHDLTIDIAVFFAWRNYLKGKIIPADHPAFIAYTNATTMLNDVRDGKISLGVGVVGSGEIVPGAVVSKVINRIPQIFTGKDSNTRIGSSGVLEDDVPIGLWSPRTDDWGSGGPVYQG